MHCESSRQSSILYCALPYCAVRHYFFISLFRRQKCSTTASGKLYGSTIELYSNDRFLGSTPSTTITRSIRNACCRCPYRNKNHTARRAEGFGTARRLERTTRFSDTKHWQSQEDYILTVPLPRPYLLLYFDSPYISFTDSPAPVPQTGIYLWHLILFICLLIHLFLAPTKKKPAQSTASATVDLLAIADRLLYILLNSNDDPRLLAQVAICGASIHNARCGIHHVFHIMFQ